MQLFPSIGAVCAGATFLTSPPRVTDVAPAASEVSACLWGRFTSIRVPANSLEGLPSGSKLGLGVPKAHRASVRLAAARTSDNHGDAPFSECIWWRTGPLFVYAADRDPVLDDGVVLEVSVDRRFLEPSWAQREHAGRYQRDEPTATTSARAGPFGAQGCFLL